VRFDFSAAGIDHQNGLAAPAFCPDNRLVTAGPLDISGGAAQRTDELHAASFLNRYRCLK
jgi:hypothetical protein